MRKEVLIKCPLGYSRIRKDGFIRRSHLVAQQSLERLLLPGEDVHHINNRTDDDRPENLQVLSHAKHASIHYKLRNISGYRMVDSKNSHCIHGHELTDKNTRLYISKTGISQRQCRECDRLRKRKYYSLGKYHYQRETE